MKITATEAYEIMVAELAGEANEAQRDALKAWLKESPDHEQKYRELTLIWNKANRDQVHIDIDQAWGKVKRKTQSTILTMPVTRFWQMAASLLLVSVLGFGLIRILLNPQITLQTAANEWKQLQLPDGSKVWLQEESRLTYQRNFWGTRRQLTLKGMAYFDVFRDEKKPFEITTTHENTIRVLGTSFEVMAYPGDSSETVTVTSGHVRFGNNIQGELDLHKNEKGSIGKSSFYKEEDRFAAEFTAWHERKLVFNNEPLDLAAKKIEHYFHVRIQFDHPEIGKCHFTGTFENPKLREVLDVLCSSLQIKWTKQKRMVHFSGIGCKPNADKDGVGK